MKNAILTQKVQKFHLVNVKTKQFHGLFFFLSTIPLKTAETRHFKLFKIVPCHDIFGVFFDRNSITGELRLLSTFLILKRL